jgi:hypothetical protein
MEARQIESKLARLYEAVEEASVVVLVGILEPVGRMLKA